MGLASELNLFQRITRGDPSASRQPPTRARSALVPRSEPRGPLPLALTIRIGLVLARRAP